MSPIRKGSFFVAIGFVIALLFNACKKDNEDEIAPEDSFDKSGMLANMGDNLILPAYSDLKTAVDSMQFLANLFITAPSLATLADLQNQVSEAYLSYQWCSAFSFGPAESEYVRSSFNTFPCDTLQINSKIAIGEYTLSAASDLDVKGFPALDYLLFRIDQNDNCVLARYTTDINAPNARNYLMALISELKLKTDAVNDGWSASGGNYISSFKSNTGSDVGGSIGMLVNELNYDLELLKNAKIGIPLGKKTLGVPQPGKVEALYSTRSLVLAAEHLRNIENIYLGRDRQNVDGLGFDDYLAHIGATYGSGSLNEAIRNRFNLANSKLSLIPETLSDAVVTSTSVVDAAYLELQQLVILLKVDMSSALGVSITYVDADGD